MASVVIVLGCAHPEEEGVIRDGAVLLHGAEAITVVPVPESGALRTRGGACSVYRVQHPCGYAGVLAQHAYTRRGRPVGHYTRRRAVGLETALPAVHADVHIFL